jgi:protein-disulfide isomerase
MTPSKVIPLSIIAGGVILAGAVYFSIANTHELPTKNQASLVRPVDPTDHVLGNPLAKVFIVEYSDFECTFCRGLHDTLHQLITDEGAQGEVAWVFREFPLTEIHVNAFKDAEAAECAGAVGGAAAFWSFADQLFARQPADPSVYGTIAASLGLPRDAFATCYANAKSTVDTRIMLDRENAIQMGAEGTPFTLILANGKQPVVLSGNYPYDAIKASIDDILGRN